MRIGRPEKSIILAKKFRALKAAGCVENKLRKVFFFMAIRKSYKTLVSKKKPLDSRQQAAVRIGLTN